MKITEASMDIQRARANPRRDTAYWRVLKLFTDHPDEVYRKRDVARELTLNYNTVKEVVRQLYAKKVIEKYRVKEATPQFSFYGTGEAIEKLRQSLTASSGGE